MRTSKSEATIEKIFDRLAMARHLMEVSLRAEYTEDALPFAIDYAIKSTVRVAHEQINAAVTLLDELRGQLDDVLDAAAE